MSDDDRYTQITLRIPKDLHAKLRRLAADMSRSLNAEIIGRLEISVARSHLEALSAENPDEYDRAVWTTVLEMETLTNKLSAVVRARDERRKGQGKQQRVLIRKRTKEQDATE